MNKKIKVFSLGLGLIGLALMAPESGKALVGECVNCHTMHNMQGGDFVDAGGPYNSLLNSPGDCVGCHTGTNSAVTTTPFVLDTINPVSTIPGDASSTSLAGGNFYWVDQGDDTKGHNVVGISAPDASNLGSVTPETPPGWNAGFDANGQVATVGGWGNNQLTCAGTYGCHGLHTEINDFPSLSGAHHANAAIDAIDGSSVGKSYRFLYRIIGYEDPRWEYAPQTDASTHNQYYGDIRGNDDPAAADPATINYLCAECHGNFHSGAGTLGTTSDDSAVSPWIRHPTDIDMNGLADFATSEFFSYGGGTHAYVPLAPVASTVVVAPLATVLGAGDAIVSCISCHRAHGSEWPDLLRWDYSACVVASADPDCGCFACHTEKD